MASKTASGIGIEAAMLGPYTFELYGYEETDGDPLQRPRFSYTVNADELQELVAKLLRAQGLIFDRMLDDMICGDCPRCKNKRMVTVRARGNYDELVHCPICLKARSSFERDHGASSGAF